MLVLLAGISAPIASSAASIGQTLVTTPLVLKDGRIAEVSIHTVPFPTDEVAPAGKTQTALGDFARSIATDCFLTAQIIGHVDKREISGRETADIHRLARARADTIQGTLIESGLPATSIASVWDWRFMIQQSRATLWVFRLTVGDDCEDHPLETVASDQVAAISDQPASSQTAKDPVGKTPPPAPQVTHAERSKPASKDRQVVPASRPKTASVQTPIPASPPRPNALADTQKTTYSASKANADVEESKSVVAALDPAPTGEKKGSAEGSNQGAIDIVYATNSSYFPAGAGDKLRAFLKTLDKNKAYVLRIQTSVDSAADVSGVSESEAARYNSWLAERRSKRVEEWLEKNGAGFNLKLEPTFLENDGSRRVRIEPSLAG
jgi:outer membrane protein OmpA-like peptidoglycan-associated protein